MKVATRLRGVAAVLAAVLVGLAACSTTEEPPSESIAIVGYSVPKPAYDELQQAFGKTPQGRDVTFSASYGASGSQSKSVGSGQPADYVAFSLEPDMARLVPSTVPQDWNAGPTRGMVTDSVVVLVVRKGNPRHITGWEDLIKPGVGIVTPNPASSGSAKWNILAAYSHVLAQGGSRADALAYLTEFYRHVVSKPASGADATSTYQAGTGDVLISYENEAIAARQKGIEVDYVVPDQTFLIENPAAVTADASQPAKDFLAFALSEAGQKIFAANGFRPVVPGVDPGTVRGANDPANPFPDVDKLTTIDDLGGWPAVNETFFAENTGIVSQAEQAAG